MSKTSIEPKTKERIERLSKLDQNELLARLLIEQVRGNDLLERNRKNTSTLVTIAIVLIILTILASLMPGDPVEIMLK